MSAPARAVPDHSPPECRAVVKFIRTLMSKGAIPEETKAAWVRQATNGATEHLRACTRYELCAVADMARLRRGERPRRFRASAAESAPWAGRRRAPREQTDTVPQPGPVPTSPRPRVPASPAVPGLTVLPTIAQLQFIWRLAAEMCLADEELRAIGLRSLGLSPLRRQWRTEDPGEAMRFRGRLPAVAGKPAPGQGRSMGARRFAPYPWRTKGDAAKTINALLDIKARRARMNAAPREREPGEEG